MIYELYEFGDRSGEPLIVDTESFDYDKIWDELNLGNVYRTAATAVIDYYHLNQSQVPILSDGDTRTKTPIEQSRDYSRHQADHYHTRVELEVVSGKSRLVDRLIAENVLSLHQKWHNLLRRYRREPGVIISESISAGHKKHPQAPYRLNIDTLYLLDTGIPLYKAIADNNSGYY